MPRLWWRSSWIYMLMCIYIYTRVYIHMYIYIYIYIYIWLGISGFRGPPPQGCYGSQGFVLPPPGMVWVAWNAPLRRSMAKRGGCYSKVPCSTVKWVAMGLWGPWGRWAPLDNGAQWGPSDHGPWDPLGPWWSWETIINPQPTTHKGGAGGHPWSIIHTHNPNLQGGRGEGHSPSDIANGGDPSPSQGGIPHQSGGRPITVPGEGIKKPVIYGVHPWFCTALQFTHTNTSEQTSCY